MHRQLYAKYINGFDLGYNFDTAVMRGPSRRPRERVATAWRRRPSLWSSDPWNGRPLGYELLHWSDHGRRRYVAVCQGGLALQWFRHQLDGGVHYRQ